MNGPLATAITTLAATPDHAPSVPRQLAAVAQLTTDRVAAAHYTSITALQGRSHITVAVSDELIRAVDEVQYREGAGPCVDSLSLNSPVGVPDIDRTVLWPGFHEQAPRLGLHASVSVPLFAGRGDAVAVLNVYSRDRVAMAPLIAGICLVHGHLTQEQEEVDEARLAELDPGGQELVAGYAAALDVRATIRLAVQLIAMAGGCGPDEAYLALCTRAGVAGTDLAEAAAKMVGEGL
ncbi:GAF domain-containing protein [Actinoplanes sp. NPDC049596]|uniref:GAF domain-containing protein n=1 Tax=unclassified Actinoplanes TaxID=2626549 RepID=UPI00342F54BA